MRSGRAVAIVGTLATVSMVPFAVPPHPIPQLVSGGSWAFVVAALGAIALLWTNSRGTGVRVLDGVAVWCIWLAFWLFGKNRLIELVPLLVALGWLAWRGLRDREFGDASWSLRYWQIVAAVGICMHLGVAVVANVADVGEASVLGARALLHGNAPYGDAATVKIFGDTYGPLMYALYVPAAAVFSKVVAAKAMAILGHLVLGVTVVCAGRRVLGSMNSALIPLSLWLLIPGGAYALSVGAHDDWVAAAAIGAIVVASPFVCGLLLGCAVGMKIFPAVLLPLLLARHRTPTSQLKLIAGCILPIALGVALVALVEPSALSLIVDKTIANQGLRGGVQVWNIPFDRWSLDLPFNFWSLWDDQIPAVHLLAKGAVVVGALFIARRVGADTPLAKFLVLGAGTMCMLLLVLNNLSWNYLSWLVPFLALAWAGTVRKPEAVGTVDT
jgi:hypothetical protein